MTAYALRYNKKSELMLIRRATASVSFYTVVVLVHHSNFVKNSFNKCANGQHDFIYSAALPLNTGAAIKTFYLNST